jgi:hypothetical protein
MNSHNITSYGKRLLPHIVDERAKAGYERPYAMYPISEPQSSTPSHTINTYPLDIPRPSTATSRDASNKFQSISYARLSNAVNRVC